MRDDEYKCIVVYIVVFIVFMCVSIVCTYAYCLLPTVPIVCQSTQACWPSSPESRQAVPSLARKRCFATFAHAGGGVGATPPGV